jgi:hypothetical protein
MKKYLNTLPAMIIIFAFIIGYILNVVKACNLDYEPNYKAEAIRVTGMFIPPLGGIVGYIDIEDTKLNKK